MSLIHSCGFVKFHPTDTFSKENLVSIPIHLNYSIPRKGKKKAVKDNTPLRSQFNVRHFTLKASCTQSLRSAPGAFSSSLNQRFDKYRSRGDEKKEIHIDFDSHTMFNVIALA